MNESAGAPSQPAPHKRWLPRLRFSLRTLVILVLLIGSALTLGTHWKPWYRAIRFPNQHRYVWKGYFSPDGHTVAFATLDGQVELYDTMTGKIIAVLPMEQVASHSSRVSFSPDSRKVLACNTVLRVCDSQSGKELFAVTSSDPPAVSVPREIPPRAMFTPDGKWIVGDPPYRIWNAETGAVRAIFPWRAWFREEQERANAPRRPERIAAALHSEDLAEFSKCVDIVYVEVAISENARYLFTAIQGSTEKQIWEVSSGRLVSRIDIPQELDSLRRAQFSPDGSLLCVYLESDKTVRVWDTVTGRQVTSLLGLPVQYILAEISCDNRRLLAHYYRDLHPEKNIYNGFEHEDNTRIIRVWDIESGSVLTSIDGIDCGSAFPGNFSPDGKRIATSYAIFDSSNGQCMQAFEGFETFTSFSPDSRSVATSFTGEDVYNASIFHRRRPEYWWGVARLPEFWLTVLFAGALVWSLRRDRKT